MQVAIMFKYLLSIILRCVVLFCNINQALYAFFNPTSIDEKAKWKQLNISDQSSLTNCTNKGPILTFTGCGLLYGYYFGVLYFLIDHFDLKKSQIRMTGISAGGPVLIALFLDLTITEAFELARAHLKIFEARKPIYFLMKARSPVNACMEIFTRRKLDKHEHEHEHEATGADYLQKQYKKYGENCIMFGTSAIKYNEKTRLFGLEHELMHSFTSVRQMFYSATVSMRVLPFFRFFGFWNQTYCFDGIFTKPYALFDKDENKNENIIRVSVSPRKYDYIIGAGVPADICPTVGYSLWHVFKPIIPIEEDAYRFEEGYRSAAKLSVINNLIKKGLVWKDKDSQTFNVEQIQQSDSEEWCAHVNQRIKYYKNTLCEHFQ